MIAAAPLPGESFVFTQFSGQPQCFLTESQLVSELDARGFEPDASLPLRELNRPPAGALRTDSAPVIYEGLFRRRRRVDLKSLREPQGEGVTFGASNSVYVAGEGGGKSQSGTLAALTCPR